MNRRRWIAYVLVGLTLTACKDEDGEIELASGSQSAELYSVVNQTTEVTFTTKDSWTATTTVDWLTVSPRSGEAGKQTVTLATTSTNRTKTTRTGQVIITSGGTKKTISVRQRAEYAIFDDESFTFPAEGGVLSMTFKTNMAADDIEAYATQGLDEWVVSADGSRTRAESTMQFNAMRVLPNTGKNAREGAIFLTMTDVKGNLLPLDTLWIRQAGQSSGYWSTDFSQDGKVTRLQTATQGGGIPIVVMGDAYVDRDIADGTYDEVMRQTMENLFSEEPVRSLRDYFDVYAVTAVSSQDTPDADHATALSTVPDLGSTYIDVDTTQVRRYLNRVSGIDPGKTLAVVVLNTTQHKGVTYLYAYEKDPDYSYAIALCPTIDSLRSESFREVLVHEAIGHGLAKLADEYVNSEYGSATDADIKELKGRQEKYAWGMNIETESNPEKVRWHTFITDSRYLAEGIGVFEGGYTFFKGVYRSSESSMMNQNDSPFNAPSRQAIYNRVMKLAEGRTPTEAEFIAFDLQHQPTSWYYHARTRHFFLPRPALAHPRVIVRD